MCYSGHWVIYPYSKEFTSTLRYLKHHRTESIRVVAPKGLGMVGIDAGEIDGGKRIGIKIENDIESALRGAKLLLLADGDFPENLIRKSINLAKQLLTNGIEVRVAMQLDQNTQRELAETARNSGVEITFYTNCETKISPFISTAPKFYNQQSTVIGVGRTFPEIDTTDFVLKVKETMEKEGYLVNTFLSKPYAKLLDCNPIPDYIGGGAEVSWQITSLNHYLESLERVQRSDIILVQYPGGMQTVDDEYCSDYGALSYLLTRAIIPDYFFCFMTAYPCTGSVLNEMSEGFAVQYHSPIDAAFYCNRAIDITRTREENNIYYMQVSEKEMRGIYDNYYRDSWSIPLYRMDQDIHIQTALKEMKNKLISYCEV